MKSKQALDDLYTFALSSEPMEMIIKDFYKVIEKDLEVLAIIKEKSVNIDLLIKIVFGFNMSTNEEQRSIYNSNVALVNILYEDEFNLLKEWVNNDK